MESLVTSAITKLPWWNSTQIPARFSLFTLFSDPNTMGIFPGTYGNIVESLVMVDITGIECITNKQTFVFLYIENIEDSGHTRYN